MKNRYPPVSREPIPLVVLLPIDDHRVYIEARRILRRLMGRKAPTLETLLIQDLRGRDATGIVDNYLDAIAWPLERGRAITLSLRKRAQREEAASRKPRRATVKMARPPADPSRN